ncbi:hypothetical protein O166_22420 [Pseudogulbenkiania ferrooxidans EGD-HP2]|uniref:Uncharacterized protein n=1 Tax=Pseudogulbenkiania ferrooxidans EGD-HP2 TaxID=1388764 RepID=A0ABN0NAE9_9NEIS|nr:hypothetical protein O166_22420 [Pseudogulbenkiania ferrooxidans EGD-HP2]
MHMKFTAVGYIRELSVVVQSLGKTGITQHPRQIKLPLIQCTPLSSFKNLVCFYTLQYNVYI